MSATAVAACIGYTIGNFLWQAFKKEKDWEEAIKMSFFQIIAVWGFLLALTLKP